MTNIPKKAESAFVKENIDALLEFLKASEGDVRITPAHISLFVALWRRKQLNQEERIHFFRYELSEMCKISSPTTFFNNLRDLHTFGYLKYTPSHNSFLGSLVEFT
ncbi:MAG: hypothetical protein DI535_03480 [Citrobacter freundii]|nr:MAG: hypothetical protein DI535_03480 [Citrobacter freundii]